MKNRVRPVIAVGFLFGIVVVTYLLTSKQFEPDIWSAFANKSEAPQDERQMAQLDQEMSEVRQRTNLRIVIVNDLIDERMSLADATEQYVKLNHINPEIMNQTRHRFPAENDHVSTALQIVSHVETLLQHEPSRCLEVTRRLKLEIAAMRRTGSAEQIQHIPRELSTGS